MDMEIFRICENYETTPGGDRDDAIWECEFEGDVEGLIESGTFYWECPECGAEHDDRMED